MSTKKIGPKGQVLIPNSIREALGLNPGSDVVIDVRGKEIVITKPTIDGSYTDYYIATRAHKLEKQINIKKVLLEEGVERFGVH